MACPQLSVVDVDPVGVAAERVRKAAAKFGPQQKAAAADWVEKADALSSEKVAVESLLTQREFRTPGHKVCT